MHRSLTKASLAVSGIAVLAAAAAVPASAGQPGTAKDSAPATAPSVAGTFTNHVTRSPTWIWQCPATNCNRGENVFPSDALTDFCYVFSGAVEGLTAWDLVYVRTTSKRYAGFIPEAYLADRRQTTPC